MRNRRGLSPIVSVLLLILIAVAAAVVIYSWFSGAASKNPTNTPQLYERISIDAVKVNTSNSSVTIYVRNIGSVTVNITSAYLMSAKNNSVICYNTAVYELISPGGVKPILLTSCKISTPGTYVVKVTTKSGVETTYTFTYAK